MNASPIDRYRVAEAEHGRLSPDSDEAVRIGANLAEAHQVVLGASYGTEPFGRAEQMLALIEQDLRLAEEDVGSRLRAVIQSA